MLLLAGLDGYELRSLLRAETYMYPMSRRIRSTALQILSHYSWPHTCLELMAPALRSTNTVRRGETESIREEEQVEAMECLGTLCV